MSLQPTTLSELQEAVKSQPHLLPRGGGSKLALSTPPTGVASLSLAEMAGVLEYEPGEFTFTALAGTPVQEIKTMLAQHGQYLPFDPPLVQKGATLGGVVAAGTSGSLRYRYGGVRDFLIGIRFVDGQGQLVRSGGKVVKNSAGFDLSKLMVGSLGRLGVLGELTFKVFPAPESYATLQVDFSGLRPALETLQQLTTSQLELDALDLEPPGRLLLRLGGLSEALPDRLARLKDFLTGNAGDQIQTIESSDGAAEQTIWTAVQEFEWVPAGWGLFKVPLTPARLYVLEERLDGRGAKRRYSAGANAGWIAWPPEAETGHYFNIPDSLLTRLDLPGLVLQGPAGGSPFLGLRSGQGLLRRVKQALDPAGRFLAY
jgi:glycolate oxidase FAD binding subunit